MALELERMGIRSSKILVHGSGQEKVRSASGPEMWGPGKDIWAPTPNHSSGWVIWQTHITDHFSQDLFRAWERASRGTPAERRSLLKHPDPVLRVKALEETKSILDDKVLVGLLADPAPGVRRQARLRIFRRFTPRRASLAAAALRGAFPLTLRTAMYAFEEDPRWLTRAELRGLVQQIARSYPEPDTRARAQYVLAEKVVQ